MKRYLLCSLTYLIVSPATLFAQTNPKLDQSGFNYFYSYLRQEGLAETRDECVMGKKFNSLNVSYWDKIVKDQKTKDRELYALKNGINIELSALMSIHRNSALIAVMKELCPEVW